MKRVSPEVPKRFPVDVRSFDLLLRGPDTVQSEGLFQRALHLQPGLGFVRGDQDDDGIAVPPPVAPPIWANEWEKLALDLVQFADPVRKTRVQLPSSRTPRPMVDWAMPVAFAIASMPTWPWASASLAAQSRPFSCREATKAPQTFT